MAAFRLAALAQTDIVNLLAWTEKAFGALASHRYQILLTTALRDIASDPERLGSTVQPKLGTAVRSYHLRHSRERARLSGGFVRRPRHFLLYRATIPGLVGVARVLHEAMAVERHVPQNYGDG